MMFDAVHRTAADANRCRPTPSDADRTLVDGILAELAGIDDVVDRTGLTVETISALVAGFHAAGVLEDPAGAFASRRRIEIADLADAFVQRSISAPHSVPSWSRLATTAVRVTGVGHAVDDLVAILGACGVPVDRSRRATAGQMGEAGGLDVIVADDGDNGHAVLADLAPTWRRAPRRRLVVGLVDDDIVLGPYLDRRTNTCFVCGVARAAVTRWRGSRSRDEARLLAALAGTEVVALVAGVTRPVVARAVIRLDLRTWKQELTPPTPVAGCAACGHTDPTG